MDMYFYYINSDYIEFLKKYEKDRRSFTCVPNCFIVNILSN